MPARQSTLELISCVLFVQYSLYALEKVLVFFNWVRNRIVSVWRRKWQEESQVLTCGRSAYRLSLSGYLIALSARDANQTFTSKLIDDYLSVHLNNSSNLGRSTLVLGSKSQSCSKSCPNT
jgi:hypothetical protein